MKAKVEMTYNAVKGDGWMNYLVIELDYGCEQTSVYNSLLKLFPQYTFSTDAGKCAEVGTRMYGIWARGDFNANELDRMKEIAIQLRGIFEHGYQVGWNDKR